jgi:hypothetical protein
VSDSTDDHLNADPFPPLNWDKFCWIGSIALASRSGFQSDGVRVMEFACPKCSSRQYTTWDPTHLVIRHWILNPGIAVNELVLDQRMPEVMYICRIARNRSVTGHTSFAPAPICITSPRCGRAETRLDAGSTWCALTVAN